MAFRPAASGCFLRSMTRVRPFPVTLGLSSPRVRFDSSDSSELWDGCGPNLAPAVRREVFPYFLEGEVVRGTGRASRHGIPTANLEDDAVEDLPETLGDGAFFGWAQVSGGEIQKMVASVGWKPNVTTRSKDHIISSLIRSVETHIIEGVQKDFVGKRLKIAIAGLLREPKCYPCFEALVSQIRKDIERVKVDLEKPEFQKLKDHEFFKRGK